MHDDPVGTTVIISLVIGFFLLIGTSAVVHGCSSRSIEKEAVRRHYGSYDKWGNFKWIDPKTKEVEVED